MLSTLDAASPLLVRRSLGALLRTTAVVGVLIVLLLPSSGAAPVRPGIATPSVQPRVAHVSASLPAYLPMGAGTHPGSLLASGPLTLSVSTSANAVCAYGLSTCNGTPSTLRVHLTASAPPNRTRSSTNVQILFLLELSPMANGCAGGQVGGGCESGATQAGEAFYLSSGAIATRLQRAHPTLNLTFGLATTQGTAGRFDDGDGLPFAAPVGNFTNDTLYGPAVNHSFPPWQLGDLDDSDNQLQTSTITALYGAFTGQSATYPPSSGYLSSGSVYWSPNATHVVVWIGATAPQDPNYREDICPLRDLEYPCGGTAGNGSMPTCEPAANFSGGASPRCEGWLTSQGGHSPDSIASLSLLAAECVNSTAGRCVVDSVVLNSTSTDPASPVWKPGTLPGGTIGDVRNDTFHVVEAGCDIARVTGGSWDGPRNSTCGNVSGSLPYVANASNPYLLSALSNISFGGLAAPGVVASPLNSTPMFEFSPSADFAFAPVLNATTTCTSTTGPVPRCPTLPWTGEVLGTTVLGWNWSSAPGHSSMTFGDVWSASFDLVAKVGPSSQAAIDRCDTNPCLATNSSSTAPYSLVEFTPWGLAFPLEESFPLASVAIVPPPPLAAALSVSPTFADAPAQVGFLVSTTGGHPPLVVHWEFGDGGAENTTTLMTNHSYLRPGFFPVLARVTDSVGTLVQLASRWVTVFPTLVATISPFSAEGGAPLLVEFGAQSQGGLAPYTVHWEFGNGSVGEGATTNFTFDHPGTYDVRSVVTDSLGRTVTTTVPVLVDPEATQATGPPLEANASAVYIPGTTCTPSPGPTPIRFTGTATGGAPPYAFAWNFGDGHSASGANATHAYAAPVGHLDARLMVTDSNGSVIAANVTTIAGGTYAGPPCASRSTGPPIPMATLESGVLAVVAMAAIVMGVRWRRKRDPP
jgi:PKD repeat protein